MAGLVKNYQLQRLSEEGKKRGNTIDGCYGGDLIIYADKNEFTPELPSKDLLSYDLVYLMTSKRRWEWYQTAEYLNQKKGTIIVNRKSIDPTYNYFLTSASDYKKQVDNNLPFPKSSMVFNRNSALLQLQKYTFPLIVKVTGGRQGKGVFKIDDEEGLVNIIEENSDKAPFTMREFIPNDGDIRVFTVGYKAVGAMKRTPTKPGEFRSNISQGGKGESFDLNANPKIRELAERVSEVTKTEIAGVDIMINKVTGELNILEVNPGPQFEGLEKYTGVNAAEKIIEYFELLALGK